MKAQTHTDALGRLFVQPKHLVDRYDMSKTTIYRLLKNMKKVPKYRKSFLDLGYHLKLVKLTDFEKYLIERDRQYLRE